MRILPALALVAPLWAAADQPSAAPSPYRPLAFLIGHCWRGSFPDSQTTDVHCFSWVYGGKFVRDEHVVHRGGGRPDDFGESLYLWDAAAHELQYLYIESAGGYSRGTVAAEADALVFPPTHYREANEEQVYRSRWQRTGDAAYDVTTEFLIEGRWQPGFTLHMQQIRS
jgi:hypothetical protein